MSKTSIGFHLRSKRLENKLSITGLAKILKTSYQNVINWENNYCVPNLRFYNPIITFLEYEPEIILNHKKLIEVLESYRKQHNLSFEKLFLMTGISPSAFWKLSCFDAALTKKREEQIKSFLKREHVDF